MRIDLQTIRLTWRTNTMQANGDDRRVYDLSYEATKGRHASIFFHSHNAFLYFVQHLKGQVQWYEAVGFDDISRQVFPEKNGMTIIQTFADDPADRKYGLSIPPEIVGEFEIAGYSDAPSGSFSWGQADMARLRAKYRTRKHLIMDERTRANWNALRHDPEYHDLFLSLRKGLLLWVRGNEGTWWTDVTITVRSWTISEFDWWVQTTGKSWEGSFEEPIHCNGGLIRHGDERVYSCHT